MRIHIIFFVSSFLVALLLAGCAQPIRNVETSLPVSTVAATIIITPTLIPTVAPTNTPSAIPTLDAKQASTRMLELLANNGDCHLPCLWGIMPGKSRYQDAQVILGPLASISDLTSLLDSSGTIWPTYIEGDLQTSINLSYLFAGDGIISHIAFKAGVLKELHNDRFPVYDSKNFGERLSPYMMSGILSELGKPSSVVLHTYGKQVDDGFEMVLLYPEKGVLARYTTEMKINGANVRGCPANAHVELQLYPSGDTDAFAKSLSTTIWAAFVQSKPINDSHWRQLENATSITVEQFYETFRQPTDKCIETPLKGWYMPEQ